MASYSKAAIKEKSLKTFPLFHVEKIGLWKTYALQQSSEAFEFLILTNRSRVWAVYS